MKNKTLKSAVCLIMVFTCLASLSISAFAYNGSTAATYAKNHAATEDYNSNYPDMPADCTNFVSQCVKAGGIAVKKVPTDDIKYKHIDDVFKTEAYWNCGKYTRTTTVAGVKVYSKTGFVWTSTWSIVSKNTNGYWGFYQHMKNRGATVKDYTVSTVSELNKFIKACSVGDVLQYRDPDSNSKSHSVIVTEKTYDSTNSRYNMKIAYHSTDTPPTDFRTVSWSKFGKDAIWTVIKFGSVT